MNFISLKPALRPAVLGITAALVIGALGATTASAEDDPTPAGDPTTSATGAAATDGPSDAPSDGTPSEAPASPSATPTQDPAQTPAPTPAAKAAAKSSTVAGYYNPSDNVLFNYPYSNATNRYAIRNQVTKAINAVPRGGKIRIAMYSINDDTLVNALIAARKRNVSTQVVVNEHNIHGTKGHASSPSFIRLYRTFGQNRGNNDTFDKVSWARYCVKSCRGTGGNVHYKMVLLSSVVRTDGTTRTDNVTMAGSPNLTMLAAQGQWNHLYTYVDDAAGAPTFGLYNQMFRQMALDRAQKTQFVDSINSKSTIFPRTYFMPHPGTTTTNDPMIQQLKDVQCTGADPSYSNKGRTIIRIGQYAWFENRGVWLAKRVRALWNAGCDISIETAVMGNTVKSILYSPSGRGRIPIRQVGTYAKDGTVLTYDHAKWITIAGHIGSSRKAIRINAGTINWNNLPLYSDDFMQIFNYDAEQPVSDTNRVDTFTLLYKRYLANFQSIWSGPHAFAPSPRSYIPGDVSNDAGRGGAQLSQGKYRFVENN